MIEKKISDELIRTLLAAQKNEITEHHIYTRLANKIRDPRNSKILLDIAGDELRHYSFWKEFTGKDVRPSRWKIFKFFWISRLLGITFGIKLMERGEEQAVINYGFIAQSIPDADRIMADEDAHEKELIGLIEEEHLKYMGSVVLGLNDALVELTGTLAGLSFALQNTRLIAIAGLITGIAASLSMAASEYLSTKSDESGENPLKSSIYTGIAYVITVAILIAPYLLLDHYLLCLAMTLVNAILIILIFNFYISVARDLPFTKRFLEMCAISLGVAALSFAIGYGVRVLIGIDV